MEEGIRGSRLTLRLIWYPTSCWVDPEPSGVGLGREAFEVRDEPALELGFGETVGSPDDHRGSTHHAVGDPALLVLEMPVGHPFGAAEEAVLSHTFGSHTFGLIRSRP